MKLLTTLSISILLATLPVCAAGNDSARRTVTGVKAESMILNGTVIDTLSKNTPYGVKHYYSVIHFGYMWLCEQATYRTTCHPKQ